MRSTAQPAGGGGSQHLVCCGPAGFRQNSSITGTLAGQVVMEGFIHLRVAPWLRRLITRSIAIIPTIVVVAFRGEHGTEKLLLVSQVILLPATQLRGDSAGALHGQPQNHGRICKLAVAQGPLVGRRHLHCGLEPLVSGPDDSVSLDSNYIYEALMVRMNVVAVALKPIDEMHIGGIAPGRVH